MILKKIMALAFVASLYHPFSSAHATPTPGSGVDQAVLGDTLANKNLPAVRPYQYTDHKAALEFLQKEVPLSHNAFVQSFIDVYTSPRYRNHLAKVSGLSKYYFPIFEKVFAEVNFPDEIKHLSIVESALNPQAVSRVGATGPWQFMFATAKVFNLSMDNYIDERKDPVAASYAAAAYMQAAYNEFGDWLLAIASYNCGKGNVNRAIQRSGLANPDFWSIRQYLPKETRDYVPAFIAMTYAMNHLDELGIESLDPGLSPATEIISVQRHISLSNIAQALHVNMDLLANLNPAYKKNIVNGSPETPRRLIVPTVEKSAYADLYAVLNNTNPAATSSVELQVASTATDQSEDSKRPLYHNVQKGESLAKIASKYHVEVQDLKVWNKLKNTTVLPGQKLAITQTANDAPISSSKTKLKLADASPSSYRVKKGDTLSGIASKHKGLTVNKLKALNNLKTNGISAGMNLRVN